MQTSAELVSRHWHRKRERIPDAFRAQPDLPGDPYRVRPLAAVPGVADGEVSRGMVREGAGKGPAADRGSALRLVPRGERGRGPAAPAADRRADAPASRLGGGRLDHDLDGTGGGPSDVSRPGHVLCPARFQLGDPTG